MIPNRHKDGMSALHIGDYTNYDAIAAMRHRLGNLCGTLDGAYRYYYQLHL